MRNIGGCCLASLILLIGPRLFLIAVWLLTDWYTAFQSGVVALLGGLFLPYTSLAWMFIYFHNAGRLEGGYVVLLILAVLFDLGVIGGGHQSRKKGSDRALGQ
jgi:hypothetical protein